MKCTKIYYKKLFSLGNYENEEIGIEIEISETETAKQAIASAKKFVEINSSKNADKKAELIDVNQYEQALSVMAKYRNYNQSVINDAVNTIRLYESQTDEDDMPF